MIYALSRNGMKIYIDFVEKNGLFVSDDYFRYLYDKCKLYSLNQRIIKNPNKYYSTLQTYL